MGGYGKMSQRWNSRQRKKIKPEIKVKCMQHTAQDCLSPARQLLNSIWQYGTLVLVTLPINFNIDHKEHLISITYSMNFCACICILRLGCRAVPSRRRRYQRLMHLKDLCVTHKSVIFIHFLSESLCLWVISLCLMLISVFFFFLGQTLWQEGRPQPLLTDEPETVAAYLYVSSAT